LSRMIISFAFYWKLTSCSLDAPQDEKKERESPTTINLLDTVAAPEFQYTYAFARSMALSADGSCLVVGQPGAGPSSHGKVYVYTRQQDSTWQIAAVLSKDFATHVDMFASTIDVSAQCTRIVVGDPCPGHGYTSYKRVLVYDVDEDGEWNTTASLRHGTPLASGGQLELSSPASREFGRQVMMSEDGRRILIQAPAANGGIFDVDLEGSVLPVGNETASALSADGNRIVSTIVDDRGNDEYAVSVRVLDYDAVADDWISYGNGVLIGMTSNSRPRLQSIINGQGSRLFLKTFLIDTWEVFVIDDTGSGFGVVQLLGQIAQEAGADLSSNAFDTDYSGNLLVVGNVLLQQENGSWDSLVTAGLDESVGLAAVSSDGSTVASRSFDSELQQDVVKVYGISTGDVPEPTVKPTAEPTPELSAQVKYFDSVMVGGGDRGFNSMYGFLLNTDGSCLVLGRPSYVPGIGGRVYVYRPQVDSTWVLSAEFGDDEGANSTSTDWFGDNVAVSADCTRIVASGTQGIGDRVAIFDLDNSGQWNLKARLWNGSRLVNGDFLELPPSSAVWFGSRVAISDDGKRVAVSASRTTTIYVFDVDYDGNIALLGDPIDAGFVGLSSDGARVLAHTTGGIGTFQYDQSQGQWAPLEDVLVLTKGGNPPLVINGAADRLARIEVEGYLYTILVYDNTGNGLHFAKDLREVALQDGVSFSNQTNLAYPADIDITESGKLIVAKPIPTGTPGIPVLVFREGAERGSWQLAAQVPPPPGIQFTTTSYGIVVSGDGSTMAVFSALEDSRQWLISVFGISTVSLLCSLDMRTYSRAHLLTFAFNFSTGGWR
jgi:WD40 repeat protein